MKKHFWPVPVLVFIMAFPQLSFAFTLKLISVSGDRAEVLVNGMPRSFPIGFISQEGIKLVSANAPKAVFQAGGESFPLFPGQTFNDTACQTQQKTTNYLTAYGSVSLPCGVTSTAEIEANRKRMEMEKALQAERKRREEERATALQAQKARMDIEAEARRRHQQRANAVPAPNRYYPAPAPAPNW